MLRPSSPPYAAVQSVFAETKSALGEILSAFEFFDRAAYELVGRHREEGKKVFSEDEEGEFYVLVETEGVVRDMMRR